MKKTFSVEEITTQINKTYRTYTKANKEPVNIMIALGHLFNDCKKAVKRKKKLSWEKYADKNFPHIGTKTRQRIMKLARSVDKDHSETLHLLEITTLYHLSTLCGRDGIENFLNSKEISLKFELTDQSEKEFQTGVAKLISESKTQKPLSSKPGPPKQLPPWLTYIDQKSKQKNFKLKPKNLAMLKKYEKTLSGIIARAEGR